MAHVVCDSCIQCYSCCVVCPVEAFRDDASKLVIDPEVCIDCGACVGECPVQAIVPDSEVPEQWAHCVEENKTKAPNLPMVNSKK